MIYYEAKDFPANGLGATGDDVIVTVPNRTLFRRYVLFGGKDGSIIVDGEGDGDALRRGKGKGNAYRSGIGDGHAFRLDTGDGHAYINGVKT